MATKTNELYYIDGSVVRKREVAAPKREERRRQAPAKRTKTYAKAARKAENSKAFDLRYTIVLSIMFIVMIVSCVIMLNVQENVETKEKNIKCI